MNINLIKHASNISDKLEALDKLIAFNTICNKIAEDRNERTGNIVFQILYDTDLEEYVVESLDFTTDFISAMPILFFTEESAEACINSMEEVLDTLYKIDIPVINVECECEDCTCKEDDLSDEDEDEDNYVDTKLINAILNNNDDELISLKGVIEQTALNLIDNNGSTTTLDIKESMRERGFIVKQTDVSTAMQDIMHDHRLSVSAEQTNGNNHLRFSK